MIILTLTLLFTMLENEEDCTMLNVLLGRNGYHKLAIDEPLHRARGR